MDACRFVLAVVVAFGHAWALLIRDYQPTTDVAIQGFYFMAGFAHSGVVLFFVLSGYWITRSVVGRADRGWRWAPYLVDRLSRLMVVLIPTLILGGALDAVAVAVLDSPTHRGITDTFVLRADVWANLAPWVIAGNLAFLQDILVPPLGSNGPLWSLAYEFWYYIWFPAALLTFRRRVPSAALAAFALAWFVPALALGFVSWLCGSAVFYAERHLGRSGRQPSLRKRFVALSLAALTAVLLWGRTGDYPLEDPLLAMSFALFLLALLLRNPRAAPGVAPFARYGARASFSLYAIHFPVMAFAAGALIGPARLAPDAKGLTLVALTLTATIGVAWVFAGLTEARTSRVRAWATAKVGKARHG
ncbi:acyltransferase family protein [Sphingomonas sp. Leaf33]|uniref:acyltransferase family protein n=1 Tax=Sphingomonas sp. Leaf33 TaxID=1736215 RepID=UPI00138F3105|nr:acyltransferase [Sphingomonas sp. Leaf33]